MLTAYLRFYKNYFLNTDTIVGLIASILSASSMLPQLVKIIKEKNADSISLGMIILIICGLSTWVYYGVLKSDWIIIGSNAFAVLINILMVIFSLKYKKKK